MVAASPWARITNGFSDPQTSVSLAQDQIVKIVGEDGPDWHKIETLDGAMGRCPRILANRLNLTLRSVSESLVVSVAAFEGQESGDLSFDDNQLITVEKEVDANWSFGVITSDAGKRLGAPGIFPNTYVKQLPGVPVVDTHTPSEPVEVNSARSAPSIPTISARSAVSQNNTVGPYARVEFPFQGEFQNELSFVPDQLVKLRKRIDADWLEGELDGKIGIFPASYVQIIVDLPGESSSRNSSIGAPGADEGIGVATVKHPFVGREVDELTLQAGDCIRVIRLVDSEWAQCRDPNSERVGIVPISFLDFYLDDGVDEIGQDTTLASTNTWNSSNTTTFPSAVNATTTPSGSWAKFEDWDLAKMEEKKAPPARPPPPKSAQVTPESPEKSWAAFADSTPSAPPDTVSSTVSIGSVTNVAERNKVLDELIATEQAFCTDMTAFEKAVTHSSKLPDKYKRVLCSGIPSLVELSLLLADTLKIEKDKTINNQCVGEVFLNFQKMFAQAYGYFFRNIEQINAIVENKVDKKMQAALSEILTSMRSYGSNCFDVPTAVGRPVHRALKYPLFLSELIKHTAVSHPDHPKLLEGVKQMSNLGQKMNESKRRKELTRKYSEEQSATLTQKLSRLSVHSVVKKSNRFKYRMGSAFGIIHLTRDSDFDALISELDQCERRLVRFNYQLVIYQKRLHHDMKRQIEVLIVAPNASRMPEKAAMVQLKPFFDILQDFVKETNYKVKDDCLKAIRVIPKKLVTKRNDKLMDYEAAKNANKSGEEVNARFRDFDALNQQVKTTLPKVIDVMNQVLRQGMQTLEDMDSELMRSLRQRFELEQSRSVHLLITPQTICFVELMDKNRLTPLKNIANKASSRSVRPLKSSMKKKASFSFDKKATYIPPVEQTGKYFDEAITSTVPSTPTTTTTTQPQQVLPQTAASAASLDAIWKAASAPPPAHSSTEKRFRSQTEEERKSLLQRAEEKGRRSDVYACVSEWPASVEARESSERTGRMLIVRPGDVVLAVRKEQRGLWFCYNGYYNGLLPSGILKSYFDRPGTNLGEPLDQLGMSALELKMESVVQRPRSTPPAAVKPTENLIDLLDDLLPPVQAIPALQPQNANALSISQQSSPRNAQAPSGAAPSSSSLYPSLFDDIPSVNWGSTSGPTSTQMSTLTPLQASPALQPLPVTPLQPSPVPSRGSASSAFPVSFEPEPTPAALAGLPPLPPTQNGTSSRKTTQEDAFSKLWDEVKQMPLSNMRSESPQPLIPTRPGEPNAVFTSSALPPSATYDMPPVYQHPPGNLSASNPFASAISETSPNYANAPMYSTPPMYASPPSSGRAVPPPPQNLGVKKDQAMVVAEFDFTPVGENQLMLREGERLALLQRHDDDNNPEWVWVKRPNGENGYVPAAYVRDI